MSDERQQSGWSDATDHAICPWCGNDRDLERRGPEWFCPCCSKQWLAFNRNDRRWLKQAVKISPD